MLLKKSLLKKSLLKNFSIKSFASVAFASLFILTAHQVDAEAIIDQQAPTFIAQAADGSSIDLASLRGKTVVLEWTNHECPFVKKHYDKSENIPDLQKEATAKGVVWLQVISSGPGNQGYVEGPTAIEINKVRGAKPTNTILDPDGQLGHLYGAQTSPHFFIINAKGILVYKGGIDSIPSTNEGDIPKATNYVREALTAISAGKKVPNPSTKPYGCSIKYAG